MFNLSGQLFKIESNKSKHFFWKYSDFVTKSSKHVYIQERHLIDIKQVI